ncbi:MAG: hypothetical protein JO055_11860 [Alphaproteobacteria bacterium]|nr:hypothetical protein [Alphaproteobacteria bacterium]
MFRTDLIAAAAATMIAAAPVAAVTVQTAEITVVAPAQAGTVPQQLSGEFWNGSRWNGVFTDETALSDDAIDAFLAAIDPVKAAA